MENLNNFDRFVAYVTTHDEWLFGRGESLLEPSAILIIYTKDGFDAEIRVDFTEDKYVQLTFDMDFDGDKDKTVSVIKKLKEKELKSVLSGDQFLVGTVHYVISERTKMDLLSSRLLEKLTCILEICKPLISED